MIYVSDVTDKTAQPTIQHTLHVLTFCRPSLAKVWLSKASRPSDHFQFLDRRIASYYGCLLCLSNFTYCF